MICHRMSVYMSSLGSPKSFLKLGLKGPLNGKPYEIIGRARFHGKISEWDTEDEIYWNGPWEYDEWYLKGAYGDRIIITEDEEGFSIEEEIHPVPQDFPKSVRSKMSFFPEKKPQKIWEMGSVELVGHEGDIGWAPEADLAYEYAEYRDGALTYSMEREVDKKTGEVYETKYYKVRRIEPVFLADAFRVKNTFVPPASSSDAVAPQSGPSRTMWIILTIISLIVSGFIVFYPTSRTNDCLPEERNELGECPESIRNSGRSRFRSFMSGGYSGGK